MKACLSIRLFSNFSRRLRYWYNWAAQLIYHPDESHSLTQRLRRAALGDGVCKLAASESQSVWTESMYGMGRYGLASVTERSSQVRLLGPPCQAAVQKPRRGFDPRPGPTRTFPDIK